MIKTTCKDMGGPCDAEITGATPEEVITAATKHVHEVEDDAHKKIVADMAAMSPEDSEKWMTAETARLAALPQTPTEATETPVM